MRLNLSNCSSPVDLFQNKEMNPLNFDVNAKKRYTIKVMLKYKFRKEENNLFPKISTFEQNI